MAPITPQESDTNSGPITETYIDGYVLFPCQQMITIDLEPSYNVNPSMTSVVGPPPADPEGESVLVALIA